MGTASKAAGATTAILGLASIAASFLNTKFKVVSQTAQKALLGVGAGATAVGGATLIGSLVANRKSAPLAPSDTPVAPPSEPSGSVTEPTFRSGNYRFGNDYVCPNGVWWSVYLDGHEGCVLIYRDHYAQGDVHYPNDVAKGAYGVLLKYLTKHEPLAINRSNHRS